MSSNNMEVKINLTPLGRDEKHNHRTVAITPENPSVSVGRASKNPNKGLLAALDNAWFDYPILSRTHAKFTASPNYHQIYIQDCGSTHGTYMDRKRLEAGVEYAVIDGEVITFGQSVTSGAVTYPAKEFRVHQNWEPRSEVQDSYSASSMKPQRLVHATSISRPTFTNDFDHSSEASREGSVQIVESNRHTFSVPSSDGEIDTEDDEEDDVQITSSVHGEEEEVSAATTPDRHAVGKAYINTEGNVQGSNISPTAGERRGLNLKGPSLQDLLTKNSNDGTSQENPINLEGACTNIIDVDTESEDDGPDVLPFHEASRIIERNPSKIWHEPQVVCPTSTVKTMMNAAEKNNDHVSEIQKDCVPETQPKVSYEHEVNGHEPASFPAESEVIDDFDSEDDDGFDYDHEFSADEDLERFPEPTALNAGLPNSSKPKVTFLVGNENPHYTTLTPPFDEFRATHLGYLSVSDGIDVSQPADSSSTWTQRPPSPSDAALARKASDPKMSLSRDIFDTLPEPKWPAAFRSTDSLFTEHGPNNAPCREEQSGAYPWPDLQSPEPRAYDQGPFSSHPKPVQAVTRSPISDNAKSQSKKATVTWADSHEDNDDFIMKVDRCAQAGKQASKITIPSLVENYLAENPKSLKRKCGGMSGNNDIEAGSKEASPSSPVARTTGYKRTFMEAKPVISSYSLHEDVSGIKSGPNLGSTDSMWQTGEDNATQRQVGLSDESTPLPDAQPREHILQTPTASMSQDSDSVAEPAFGSVPINTPVQGHDTEGPARKKARTSSSSSGGIGKFVMGVGFGLVGAAAAFVATIPASVYEEALREFGNAA